MLSLLMSLALLPAPQLDADQYQLNGKPIDAVRWVFKADGQEPVPVLSIERFTFLWNEPKASFFVDESEGNALWLTQPGQPRQLIAARITHTYSHKKNAQGKYDRIVVNPLKTLGAAELAGLRGLLIDGWNAEIAQSVAKFDGKNLFLELSGDAVVGTDQKLIPLPQGLRFLRISENNNIAGIQDYGSLGQCNSLLWLSIRSMNGAFDGNALKSLDKLQELYLSAWSSRHLGAIGQLTKLRKLDVSGIRDLGDVSFVKNLKSLQTLNIAMTGVPSLEALAMHPALTEIDARGTPLSRLPLNQPMPALQSLSLINSKVSDSDLAAFRKLNPQCKTSLHWASSLAEVAAGTTRLRVRSGGTCHRRIEEEKTLFEEKNPAAIAAFVKLIDIDESEGMFYCMCCGEPSFEFYKDNQLVTTVGYHHGTSMRWNAGWPSDGRLSTASSKAINQWLADRIPSIKEQQQRVLRESEKDAKQTEAFFSAFPVEVRKLFAPEGGDTNFDVREKAAAKKIIQAMPDEMARLRACCQAYSAYLVDGQWPFGSDGKQRQVQMLVKSASGEAVAKLLEAIKNDKLPFLAAARFFFYDDLDQNLSPEEQNKWRPILARHLFQYGPPEAHEHLLRMLSKHPGDETNQIFKEVWKTAAPTPPPEKKNRKPGEPSAKLTAALLLAQAGNRDLLADVKRELPNLQGSDRLAAELALLWMGEKIALRPEHFNNESYSLGYAAIGYVRKVNGAEGLELLIQSGTHHPWALVEEEAEKVAFKIIGKPAPEDDKREALLEWWKKEGSAFVDKLRNGKK